jgi:glucose-6-phosphate isomerase
MTIESIHLGEYLSSFNQADNEMEKDRILPRIWGKDYTVWNSEPDEISNRLGWLDIHVRMKDHVARLNQMTSTLLDEGYTDCLVLGMGGSSLAPDVFRRTSKKSNAALKLTVLDSTRPEAVLGLRDSLDLSKTIFIVATKSGGTVETLSFFKTFYNWISKELPDGNIGDHFLAITDPGSSLVDLAAKYSFRDVFENDPDIGGRYSALSYFGLVPAAMAGLDISQLLASAEKMATQCAAEVPPGENPAVQLGAALGELAKHGRDKLTLVSSPAIAALGDWIEQLIAESTGKDGMGILPVVGELVGTPHVYQDDRVFVAILLQGDHSLDSGLEALRIAGHPVIISRLADMDDLGGEFFKWELATAIAGHRLGIHPFNQPNVEAAKNLARKMVDEYAQSGHLPELTQSFKTEQFEVSTVESVEAEDVQSVGSILASFMESVHPGDYVCLQAFLPPDENTSSLLVELATRIRHRTHMAVSSGFGPRYLHSTGQLHKGDAGRGRFIQLTSTSQDDLAIPTSAGIPDSSITFGVLIAAQALGDRDALIDAGRSVLRVHILGDELDGLQVMKRMI